MTPNSEIFEIFWLRTPYSELFQLRTYSEIRNFPTPNSVRTPNSEDFWTPNKPWFRAFTGQNLASPAWLTAYISKGGVWPLPIYLAKSIFWGYISPRPPSQLKKHKVPLWFLRFLGKIYPIYLADPSRDPSPLAMYVRWIGDT